MLEHLLQMLQRDFEVSHGARWTSLVETDAATHPDVIIADISMPILSGLEAANYLKRPTRRPRSFS